MTDDPFQCPNCFDEIDDIIMHVREYAERQLEQTGNALQEIEKV